MGLDKIDATLKSGGERLTFENKTLNFSLLDFWRWSVSDILSNATRGRFAEFIVATATQIDTKKLRDEWSAYDIETNEGIKLEIKSSAFIHSWFQKKLSTIAFGTKAALYWDSLTNELTTEKKRHADVYVFCLLKHINKATIDPLHMDQWEFYLLATRELNNYKRSQLSISLQSLKGLTKAVTYNNLHQEIIYKHQFNND